MAMGVPYIGIDTNTGLRDAYAGLVALEPSANVRIFFQPAETFDFSQHTYDLVLTSPPYYRLEEYDQMPDYGSKEGFFIRFLRPVVAAAWEHLSVGGHMVLNMPEDLYEAIRECMPPISYRLHMPIQNRHSKTPGKRGEPIFVWHKTPPHASSSPSLSLSAADAAAPAPDGGSRST